MSVVDKLVRSQFFENKLINLRRWVPYFQYAYNRSYDINIHRQNRKYTTELEQEVAAAQCALTELGKPLKTLSHHGEVDMPNVIWMYWNTPLETAPEVVKLSIRSWTELNPSHEVRVLTDSNLRETLGFDFHAMFKLATVRLGMAAKSDILRLYLLANFGGVWADATTFCLQPLEQWLPSAMSQHQFFSFRHQTNASRPVEAWFLAAPKQSAVIKLVLALFIENVFKPRQHSLFISNRRKMMGKIGIKRDHPRPLYADVLRETERVGFMPYFSVGYFFNEALRTHFSPEMIDKFYQLPNAHAIHGSDFSVYQSALVGKQTYKGSYQSEELFLQRKRYLEQLLNHQK